VLDQEFAGGPARHLRQFLEGGSRGFAQERRVPPSTTLRLRVPEEEAAVVRARAG
jgi:hypothetical protein